VEEARTHALEMGEEKNEAHEAQAEAEEAARNLKC